MTTNDKLNRLLRADTQVARLFRALASAKVGVESGNGCDGWVSLPDLVERHGVGYACHSRVAELRDKYGLDIENKTDNSTKPHKSWYRLADQTATDPQP